MLKLIFVKAYINKTITLTSITQLAPIRKKSSRNILYDCKGKDTQDSDVSARMPLNIKLNVDI